MTSDCKQNVSIGCRLGQFPIKAFSAQMADEQTVKASNQLKGCKHESNLCFLLGNHLLIFNVTSRHFRKTGSESFGRCPQNTEGSLSEGVSVAVRGKNKGCVSAVSAAKKMFFH